LGKFSCLHQGITPIGKGREPRTPLELAKIQDIELGIWNTFENHTQR